MKSVFGDSFYFFALLNSRDSAHAEAVAFIQSFTGRIVTTGGVLTELADGSQGLLRIASEKRAPASLPALITVFDGPAG
jgi:hypothetical protein